MDYIIGFLVGIAVTILVFVIFNKQAENETQALLGILAQIHAKVVSIESQTVAKVQEIKKVL